MPGALSAGDRWQGNGSDDGAAGSAMAAATSGTGQGDMTRHGTGRSKGGEGMPDRRRAGNRDVGGTGSGSVVGDVLVTSVSIVAGVSIGAGAAIVSCVSIVASDTKHKHQHRILAGVTNSGEA
jgi:hypothetical protein